MKCWNCEAERGPSGACPSCGVQPVPISERFAARLPSHLYLQQQVNLKARERAAAIERQCERLLTARLRSGMTVQEAIDSLTIVIDGEHTYVAPREEVDV